MKTKRYAIVFTMVILVLALTMTDFAGMTGQKLVMAL